MRTSVSNETMPQAGGIQLRLLPPGERVPEPVPRAALGASEVKHFASLVLFALDGLRPADQERVVDAVRQLVAENRGRTPATEDVRDPLGDARDWER